MTVGAAHRREQERAAANALRVTDRRDRHVDRLAWLGERRQRAAERDRRDVLQLRIGPGRDLHAQPVEHALQALHGELRLAGLVAGAV